MRPVPGLLEAFATVSVAGDLINGATNPENSVQRTPKRPSLALRVAFLLRRASNEDGGTGRGPEEARRESLRKSQLSRGKIPFSRGTTPDVREFEDLDLDHPANSFPLLLSRSTFAASPRVRLCWSYDRSYKSLDQTAIKATQKYLSLVCLY